MIIYDENVLPNSKAVIYDERDIFVVFDVFVILRVAKIVGNMRVLSAVVAAACACSVNAFVGGAAGSRLLSRAHHNPAQLTVPRGQYRTGLSAPSSVVTLRAIGQRPSENKVTTDKPWAPDTFVQIEASRCAELQKIFNKFDNDQDGKLDEDALQKALEDVRGEKVTLDYARQMVALLDENKDGFIDFAEFRKGCPCQPKDSRIV